MRKSKLYLDFDGVVTNSISAIVSLYNEDFRAYPDFKFILPEEIHTWNFEECNCATSDVFDVYFNTPRFFEKLKFMNHAGTILWLLSYRFDFTIVSHGNTPNLALKEKWINKEIKPLTWGNHTRVNFIGVDFKDYSDKSHVDMSDGIFVDDSYKNLLTSNAKHKIVFGKVFPWNEENEKADEEHKYVRCENWVELYQEITRITNTESYGMEDDI